MEDFVYSLPQSSAQDQLEWSIQGKGAFRRFKDGVRRLGLDQKWYDFLENAYKQKATHWCEENGIEYE